MSERDLAELILQHVGISSLKNARRSATETGCVVAQCFATSTGLDSYELDCLIFNEVVEDADRVRSSTNADDDRGREFALCLLNLCAGFSSDHAMEIAHHGGIGMSSEHAAEQIMSGSDIRDPIPHRLVNSILECARAGVNDAKLSSH